MKLNRDLSPGDRRALVDDTLEHLAAMRHEPPATLTLRFCAACGRDERQDQAIGRDHGRHWPVGGAPRCPGVVQTLTYERRPDDEIVCHRVGSCCAPGCSCPTRGEMRATGAQRT